MGLATMAFMAVTPAGLMALIQTLIKPPVRTPAMQLREEQLGLQALEATITASFEMTLPEFFGNGMDPFQLSCVPSFAIWDETDHVSLGKRDQAGASLERAMDRYFGVLDGLRPSVEGGMLLRSMAESCRRFLNALFEWMSSLYRGFTVKGSLTSKDAWDLDQMLTCTVFSDLRAATVSIGTLNFGTTSHTTDVGGRILWASYQVQGVLQEYTRLRFMGHPSVAPVLNRYLLTKVTLKSHLVKLETSLESKLAAFAVTLAQFGTRLNQVGQVAAGAQKAANLEGGKFAGGKRGGRAKAELPEE